MEPVATTGTTGDALDIPFTLRANDIVRHIVSVDSRFRQNPQTSTSSDFYFRLLTPVRNILRLRVTSIEFPNNYLFFTAARKNVTIRILYNTATPTAYLLTIPGGNYTACEMADTLNSILTGAGLTRLTVVFNIINGTFTFTGTQYFAIDVTPPPGSPGVELYIPRPFDYGLGYYLGFSRKTHTSVADTSGTWIVTSDQCASFSGDNYVFLKINEFDCVSHQATEQTFTALAKIVLRDPKNYMAFDDYASQHAKEVTFPVPQDLTRLHIQVLDAYGNVIDLCSSQISFSIEVLEVRNLSLYNSIRDSITVRYV
jgi:hypothetical protein